MKLHYIKTNIGNFYKEVQNGYYSSFNSYILNGVNGSEIPRQNDYLKLDKPLKTVQKREKSYGELVGFKLKNPKLASALIPETLTVADVSSIDFEGDSQLWTGTRYEDFSSLYTEDRTEPVDHLIDVAFEIVQTQEFTIEGYGKPEAMTVRTSTFQNDYTGTVRFTEQGLEKIVCYEDIEKLLTPEPLLYTRPCSLTSKQVYAIVRKHIQENLDRTVAKITSDYDFCFTVKRIVQVTPFTVKTDVSSLRARKPKFVTKTVDTKEVEVFEMTWAGYAESGKGYNNYTCIEGWKANNLREMQEYIKQYLDDLMYNLNAKVKECECCNGTGHVLNEIKTNQRSFK